MLDERSCRVIRYWSVTVVLPVVKQARRMAPLSRRILLQSCFVGALTWGTDQETENSGGGTEVRVSAMPQRSPEGFHCNRLVIILTGQVRCAVETLWTKKTCQSLENIAALVVGIGPWNRGESSCTMPCRQKNMPSYLRTKLITWTQITPALTQFNTIRVNTVCSKISPSLSPHETEPKMSHRHVTTLGHPAATMVTHRHWLCHWPPHVSGHYGNSKPPTQTAHPQRATALCRVSRYGK